MITVYTIAFNEALMLQFMVNHYRKMFPRCKIVVYDNFSNDGTVAIARNNGCEVIPYNTGGKLSDKTYLEIKNNCWKDAKTDWVIVCDVDELLLICELDLAYFGTETAVKAFGYNMVNLHNNLDVKRIDHGVRAASYDKVMMFNRTKITEINYGPGCHSARPEGQVVYSGKEFKCLHYKYINIDYMITRHAMFAKRLSDDNKRRGYGAHYLYSPERITKEFIDARHNAVKIL